MIIIGEKINATRKSIGEAIAARNPEPIILEGRQQIDAGAQYLDINGGDPREGAEAANMEWLMNVVQGAFDVPVTVDSANPDAVRVGLSMAKKKPILNSISLEHDRLESMLPVLAKFDCMVIGLLMSDDGAPCGTEDRVERTARLVEKFGACGKGVSDIIIDPCFFPVSADCQCGRVVIDAIAAIRKRWPEIHIGGGCSNISFGLPKRKFINFALLSQAIYNGMDVGLINPCVEGIMATILAAEAVAGRDDYCMTYVMAEREGKLK